ncbi:MAG: 3-deoxy-D-manno-octulosonic acid transferase [Bacteroidales bacterium]|nr:3-deoxy-D-manno-octulosonic acid transferase [Bacteroidales bacterium]
MASFEKINSFIKGRIGLLSRIEKSCAGQGNIIWVHSASYGEFEEISPVIELMKAERPEIRVLVTFFSPSGYDYHKNNPIADWVFFIPLDTIGNAKRFLNAVNPIKAIFSISDYWLNLLFELRRRRIETYLVSARFEKSMFYFKPAGFLYRKALRTCFTKILVRDAESLELLEKIGAVNASLMGDPRMDRVMRIAGQEWRDPTIDRWSGGAKVFVAGSVLPDEDEAVISDLANSHPEDKFLIVPHEIGDREVESIKNKIHGRCEVYTRLSDGYENAQVLIINTVGLLAKVYRYGFAAYVGSGFDCSPHSVIEPAAYGIPVSFGPKFGSYRHCQGLIDAGGGHSISDSAGLSEWYDGLKYDPGYLAEAGKAAREYCEKGSGVATSIAKTILYGNRIPE